MPPPRSPLRTDVTAEQLRLKASRVTDDRQKRKWNTLAAIYAGEIKVDDLPEPDRTSAVRWLKELYKETDVASILEGRKPGPPVPVPQDRSAAEFRTLSETATGKYKKRILGCALIVKTGDLALAAQTAGVSPLEFLKLLEKYRLYGLQALEEKSARIEPARLDELRKEVVRAKGTPNEKLFASLLALSEEGTTLRAVCKAYGIKESTMSGRVARFNMGGAGEFARRSERDALASTDHESSDLLRRTAEEYRYHPQTYRNCMAVSEVLSGQESARVAKKHGMERDILKRLLEAFKKKGVYAVVGDRAFEPKGTVFANALVDAALRQTDDERRRALGAASRFHKGDYKRLSDCAKRDGVDKFRLKSLLGGIKDAEVAGIPAALAAYWKGGGS